MKISPKEFKTYAEEAGISSGLAQSMLEDIQSENGEFFHIESTRPLIRMLMGWPLNGGDQQRVLSLAADLYQDDSALADDSRDVKNWTEEKILTTRLLISTLEHWLTDGKMLQIKPDNFAYFAFLVNRLAKIVEKVSWETDIENPEIKKIKDFNPEAIGRFIYEVTSFAEEALSHDKLESAVAVYDEAAKKDAEAIKDLQNELQQKKEDLTGTQNYKTLRRDCDRAFSGYNIYLKEQQGNGELRKEIREGVDDFLERLDRLKRVKEIKYDAEQLSFAAESHKQDLIHFLVEYPASDICDFFDESSSFYKTRRHNGPSAGEASDAFSGVLHYLEKIKKDRRPSPNLHRKKQNVQQKPKASFKGSGLGSLAGLKLEDEPREPRQTLLEMMKDRLGGPIYKRLMHLRKAYGKPARALEALERKEYEDVKRQIGKKGEQETRHLNMMRMIKMLESEDPSFWMESWGVIQQDVESGRPAVGLYLLKTALVCMDKVRNATIDWNCESDPYLSVDLALRAAKSPSGGPETHKFEGPYDVRFNSVHYMPKHVPFAAMAVAYLMDNAKKAQEPDSETIKN